MAINLLSGDLVTNTVHHHLYPYYKDKISKLYPSVKDNSFVPRPSSLVPRPSSIVPPIPLSFPSIPSSSAPCPRRACSAAQFRQSSSRVRLFALSQVPPAAGGIYFIPP